MYVMTQIISITDFRKNLFNLAEQVFSSGEEIEVEKEGRRIVKMVRIDNDPKERAKRALELLPKLGGIWRKVPARRFKELNEFVRGKKEKKYMEELGKDY